MSIAQIIGVIVAGIAVVCIVVGLCSLSARCWVCDTKIPSGKIYADQKHIYCKQHAPSNAKLED